MKRLIILVLLTCFSLSNLLSQRIDTIYYNNKAQVVSRKKFDYYRIARQDSAQVKVFDYTKSGKIIKSGAYRNFNFSEEVGPFYYYTKDRIRQIEIHQPSKYPQSYNKYKSLIDNIPIQPDSLKLIIYFYKNNNVSAIGYASSCCFWFGPWFYFTKKGEPYSMVTYLDNKREGPYIVLIDNTPFIKGQYKNDKKDGEWSWYGQDGKVDLQRIYKEGKITSVKVLR